MADDTRPPTDRWTSAQQERDAQQERMTKKEEDFLVCETRFIRDGQIARLLPTLGALSIRDSGLALSYQLFCDGQIADVPHGGTGGRVTTSQNHSIHGPCATISSVTGTEISNSCASAPSSS